MTKQRLSATWTDMDGKVFKQRDFPAGKGGILSYQPGCHVYITATRRLDDSSAHCTGIWLGNVSWLYPWGQKPDVSVWRWFPAITWQTNKICFTVVGLWEEAGAHEGAHADTGTTLNFHTERPKMFEPRTLLFVIQQYKQDTNLRISFSLPTRPASLAGGVCWHLPCYLVFSFSSAFRPCFDIFIRMA